MIGLPHFMGFAATLGLAAILDAVMSLAFGANEYTIRIPGMPAGSISILGAQIANRRVLISLMTLRIRACA
jgi:branched-subunit amino acid ABC-type transport system permease component